MKIISLNYGLLLMATVALTFTVAGCQKEGPTKAVITVTTVDKNPVAGAVVFLHANDASKPGDFSYTETTDASGKANFEFKLEAIYTIEAERDSLFGTGSVRLIKGQTVNETVIVY